MRKRDHLSNDLLLSAMDDELRGAEIGRVESHLRECEECRHNYLKLRLASAQVESIVSGIAAAHSPGDRERLAEKLETLQLSKTVPQRSGEVLRRFGWGMAIAAALGMALILLPGRRSWPSDTRVPEMRSSEPLEINGETFMLLPYSNPELPFNASQIVQMQVPVSSLTEAGVIFEPVSNELSERNASVLADVLVGIDGQPIGVHVLGVE